MVSIVIFLIALWRERQALAWRSAFVLPTLLFIAAGAVAVVTAPSLTSALGLYRAYLLEPIAFAIVVLNVVQTTSRALLLLGGLAAGAAVAGLANSVVVLLALVHHSYDVTATPPVVIYFTANAVALYVVPLVGVALALALYGHGIARWGGIAFAALGIIITTLSFSRGGYMALAAVVVVAALSHRRRLYLLAAAIVAFAALLLVEPVRHRIVIETQNVYGNTVQSRIDLWTAAIKLLEQRPLFGAGLSGFQQRVAPFLVNFHSSALFIDPHNIVLNFWVETGLLGLVAMAWMFVLAFTTSWRGWRHGDVSWSPYHLGVLLAMIAVVVHGLVDVPYFKNDLSLEFWVLIAITLAGHRWGGAPGAAKS